MEIRVDNLHPVPARVRLVVNGQNVVMDIEETTQLLKALENALTLAKKAK